MAQPCVISAVSRKWLGFQFGKRVLSATVLSSVQARSAYCGSPVSCQARPSLYMRSTTLRESFKMTLRTSGA